VEFAEVVSVRGRSTGGGLTGGGWFPVVVNMGRVWRWLLLLVSQTGATLADAEAYLKVGACAPGVWCWLARPPAAHDVCVCVCVLFVFLCVHVCVLCLCVSLCVRACV